MIPPKTAAKVENFILHHHKTAGWFIHCRTRTTSSFSNNGLSSLIHRSNRMKNAGQAGHKDPIFLLVTQFGWTAVCAVAMMAQTRILIGEPGRSDLLTAFVLTSTLFAYNFVSRVRWQRWAAWASGIAAGWIFFWLPPTVQAGVVASGVLWALYYGLQRPGNAGLRARPLLKPFAVSASWAWVTVMLPVLNSELAWSDIWGKTAWMFAGRAAFIFALALAYDLHDLDYDRQRGLDTLARRLDFGNTFWLIHMVLTLSAGCVAANFFLKNYPSNMTAALLLSLVLSAAGLRVLFRKSERTAWRKVWIDATMVGQFLLLAVAVLLGPTH